MQAGNGVVLTRRRLLGGAAGLMVAGAAPAAPATLAELEAQAAQRLGLAVLDMET